MKFFWMAALLLGASVAWAADDKADAWPEGAESVVVRAFYDDAAQLQQFAQHTQPWTVDKGKKYFVVDVDQLGYAQLIQSGLRLEIDKQRTIELNAPRLRDPNQRAGIPGFSCYRTVDETYATGAQLASDYPTMATWTDIGDSWKKQNGAAGSDIFALRLTNSAIGGFKPKLFIMSAIHAREYTTAELNTRFAEYLLESYGNDADATWLLDHNEVHLVLQSNPDGRKQAQNGLSWRKNTNQNYCGATSSSRGADLNRNFSHEWGCCGGSSGSGCSATYRGPGPDSEPETDAIQDYVRSIFADARGPNANDPAPANTSGVFIDVHSFSELVLWPWGYTSQVAPNGNQMRTLGRRLAHFNGYSPEQAVELYITDGTTDDFAYGELGIAAYTYELGTSFFQDCSTFESTILPDNLPSLVYAAKSARAPYLLPSGPSTTDVMLTVPAVAQGATTTLSALIDDTPISAANGVEATQNISSAFYTIDTPIWDSAATPVAMTAADGSFNSKTETASAIIDTTGLSNGRHTIYVHGLDTTGAPGPVSAVFLYVIDPASAPRIAGRVLAADSGQGLAATVSAGNFSTTTDANGDYELLLIAGTYALVITPDDAAYGGQTVSGLTVTDFGLETQNIALFPFCDVFADDMETTAGGWLTQLNWGRTNSQSSSPVWSYTDSPSGNYSNNQSTSLTSPVVDLSGVSAVTLSFASRCDTEATYDFCHVEVSNDGANWNAVASYDGRTSSFTSRSLNVPALAGAANARVRFRLSTDVSVTEDGWYVDDVALRAAGPQCVTLTDSDGDGVNDLLDNCTLLPNAAQIDSNGDGYGNACDPDVNDDGIVNAGDLGLLRQAFFSTGVSVTDFNADGVTNAGDLGVMRTFFFQPPGPSALAD